MTPTETMVDRIYELLVSIRLKSGRPKLTDAEREHVEAWVAEAAAAAEGKRGGEPPVDLARRALCSAGFHDRWLTEAPGVRSVTGGNAS